MALLLVALKQGHKFVNHIRTGLIDIVQFARIVRKIVQLTFGPPSAGSTTEVG